MKRKASSLPQSSLALKLQLLLLSLSLGLILNIRRVMSNTKRERPQKNQHEGGTKGIHRLARPWLVSEGVWLVS